MLAHRLDYSSTWLLSLLALTLKLGKPFSASVRREPFVVIGNQTGIQEYLFEPFVTDVLICPWLANTVWRNPLTLLRKQVS